MTCPQCNSDTGVKYPNGSQCYCEDCGWPDEDFAPATTGIIERFRQWRWRRELKRDLLNYRYLMASQKWHDRMFKKYYGKCEPLMAVQLEFGD